MRVLFSFVLFAILLSTILADKKPSQQAVIYSAGKVVASIPVDKTDSVAIISSRILRIYDSHRNLLHSSLISNIDSILIEPVLPDTFILMTYNIHHGEGEDGVLDLQRIARIISKESPQFVAIQEVDSVTTRTNKVDQLQVLASLTGMHPTFARAIPYKGGAYGVGILSSQAPLSVKRIPMPNNSENRVLLICEFDSFYVASTHLSLVASDRIESLLVIFSELDNLSKPLFLAGDWNAVPSSDFVHQLQSKFILLNNLSEPTHPSPSPTSLIDYVAVSTMPKLNPVAYKQAKVLPESDASDHRPVVVSFTLK